jgi:hypothetical protein
MIVDAPTPHLVNGPVIRSNCFVHSRPFVCNGHGKSTGELPSVELALYLWAFVCQFVQSFAVCWRPLEQPFADTNRQNDCGVLCDALAGVLRRGKGRKGRSRKAIGQSRWQPYGTRNRPGVVIQAILYCLAQTIGER